MESRRNQYDAICGRGVTEDRTGDGEVQLAGAVAGQPHVSGANVAILHDHRITAAALVADAIRGVADNRETLVCGDVEVRAQKRHRTHATSVGRGPDAFDGLGLRRGADLRGTCNPLDVAILEE